MMSVVQDEKSCKTTNNIKSFVTRKRYVKPQHNNGSELQNSNKLDKLFCEECKYETNNKITLSIHVRSLHDKEVRYHCSQCVFKAFHRSSVKSHIQSKHKDEDARVLKNGCIHCKSGQKHTECIIKSETETCSKIRKFKPRKIQPVGDILENVPTISCQNCVFITNSKVAFKTHNESIHDHVLRYYCSECNFKTYWKRDMTEHIKTSHPDGNAGVLGVNCLRCSNNIEHERCTFKNINVIKRKVVNRTVIKRESNPIVKLECKFCHFIELNGFKKLMIRHYTKEHPTEKMLECDSCQYKTNYSPNLRGHKESKHGGAMFQCDTCDLKTKWKSQMSEHKRDVHGIYRYKIRKNLEFKDALCDLCGFTAKSKKIMENHIISQCTATSKKPITCAQCGFIAKSAFYLDTHKYEVHETEQPNCDVCGVKRKNKISLLFHIKRKHTNKLITCAQCGFIAKSIFYLDTHKYEMHEHGQLNCDVCGVKRKNKISLLFHMKREHTNKLITCAQCGFIAKSIFYLDTHKYEIHETGQPSCDVCGVKRKNKISLLIHMKQKHPADGLACDTCKHEASNAISLKKHKKNNHQGIKYPCTVCTYVGPNNSLLQKHRLKQHTALISQQGKFKCYYCDYKTVSVEALKSHSADSHVPVKTMQTTVKVSAADNLQDESNNPVSFKSCYPQLNILKVASQC